MNPPVRGKFASALLSGVEWIPVEGAAAPAGDGVPCATHYGWLDLGTVRLKVYQLDNGMRVFDLKDVEGLLRHAVSGM